jgi:hypothetical protein
MLGWQPKKREINKNNELLIAQIHQMIFYQTD